MSRRRYTEEFKTEAVRQVLEHGRGAVRTWANRMEEMTLYRTPPTRALRAFRLINGLETDCEIVELNLCENQYRSAGMIALNPTGKLP